MPVSAPPRALSALVGLPVLLFALITWQVVADGPLVGVDERLSGALVHPDRFSELLSDLGNVQVAVPVLVVALAYAAWHGRVAGVGLWWLPPLAGVLAMVLVPALVAPLKEWTDRPGTPAVPPAVGYYPSGHTATAVVAYGAATVLLGRLRAPAVRRTLVVLCALLVLGTSYGLVRRGYHWPLDVVASWCLGVVLLAGVRLVERRTPPGRTPRDVSRSTRRSSSGTPSSSNGPS
ncbi:phosphatase PAP2 family protein [Streptomyces sp. ME02-6987-2C]|uniref:phosphatase PAP2 family protein n=1 Tax=unclassified Streptomyces TaxID=2593676 RepID=UPI0029B88F72|nr:MULTISPECIES: phosphatase PAP2 family protein [unclassified Streptomyces]MDX3370517.1 phosphatase PAP2 family protein [Streptomyces sp. ME02-6987-2C]MDX3425472.1 phosphatase PAP2 family protein [Streptomyces sp. ME02-6985-2c]